MDCHLPASPLMSIVPTPENVPSKLSKPTSSASWPALTHTFQTTCGTSSSHKPNLHSTYYANPRLPQPFQPGSPSTASSIDAIPFGPIGCPPPPGNPGTSMAQTASASDPPYTTTDASKLWTPPPTVSSSQIQPNSATAISSNPPSPMTTAFSMQSTTYPLPLPSLPSEISLPNGPTCQQPTCLNHQCSSDQHHSPLHLQNPNLQAPMVVPTPEPTQQQPPHPHRPLPQLTSAPSPPPSLISTTLPSDPMNIDRHTCSQRRPLDPNTTKASTRHNLHSNQTATSVLNHNFVGIYDSGTNKHAQGTDMFYVIDYDNIPFDRCKEIIYSKVVCKVHHEKSDPDRTRITIGINSICYPGDVGTKTAPLELIKLMINSVLSHKNAKFCTFVIISFYLGTPFDHPEYIRIRINDIPQEFISTYNLTHHVQDGWVYFQIIKGVYGLPQAGILANMLLETRLNASGYYQLDATPGLWCHKWRPIMFTLIVDYCSVEYVGLQHAYHLHNVIQKHYNITKNWKDDLYACINLAWNNFTCTCRLTMEG
eukprot:CCRYP_008771-RA/>CCRYP_008771-RA protein AED:0.34 eAED:0.27 QI:0/0/0/1/0/0/5/0/537